jgi:mannan endo-1,4-beta-mannosidase
MIRVALVIAAIIFALPVTADERTPFFGLALHGAPIEEEMIKKNESESGLSATLINFFIQWPSDPHKQNFPMDSVQAIWRRGAVPVLTWEPMVLEPNERAVLADEILGGKWDAYLDSFAESVREIRVPIIIRFGHEMNLKRYHWGTTPSEYGPDSPKVYREVYLYVWRRFQREGVSNVLWAFCPNNDSDPWPVPKSTSEWNSIAAYFPGVKYVDIIGVDGYNWGTSQTMQTNGWDSSWKSFHELFARARSELESLAPSLPFFIFETSSSDNGGDKKRWFQEIATFSRELDITGVIFFHVKKEQDWRVPKGVVKGGRSGSQEWAKGMILRRIQHEGAAR